MMKSDSNLSNKQDQIVCSKTASQAYNLKL